MTIRPATADDRHWIAEVLRTRWGGTGIVVGGRLIDGLALPALIAEDEGRRCGLATLEFRGDECEIVTLDALEQYRGVGTALVEAAAATARERGAQHLLVMTTNDNLDALRFYQRRGFQLHTLRPNAIAHSRQLKPTIPETGNYNIPLRDEIGLICML